MLLWLWLLLMWLLLEFFMSAQDFKRLTVMQPAAASALPEECPARTIVAPRDRSEHALLQRCRRFSILDQLRVAARTTRRVGFQEDMATLVNMVRVSMADVLFRFLQGQQAEQVAFQHRATTKMLDVVVDIRNQIYVLRTGNIRTNNAPGLKKGWAFFAGGADSSLRYQMGHCPC